MKSINTDVLALSMRPDKFSGLIGQKRAVNQILSQVRTGRLPRAWLFHGPTGNGKTTAARILGAAVQQKYTESFGEDNKVSDCEAITEINASDINGVEEIRKIVEMSVYLPPPGYRKRVFILDEAHRITPQAQNLLLKPFEDGPKSTVWVVCTTEPGKLLLTLRRRSTHVRFEPLLNESIKQLVLRAKKHVAYEGNVGKFVERMDALGISSPGLILNAFEAFVAQATMPDTATDLSMDPISVCRMFTKGNWQGLAEALKKTPTDQARELQIVLMGYLRTMVLGRPPSANAAKVILDLSNAPMLEGAPLLAWLSAVLYKHSPFKA